MNIFFLVFKHKKSATDFSHKFVKNNLTKSLPKILITFYGFTIIRYKISKLHGQFNSELRVTQPGTSGASINLRKPGMLKYLQVNKHSR